MTDADGDSATASINLGAGVFTIQDDGPSASVNGSATLDTLVLDESRPEGSDTTTVIESFGSTSLTESGATIFSIRMAGRRLS